MQSKQRQRNNIDDSISPDLNYEKSKGYTSQGQYRSKSTRHDLSDQDQVQKQRLRQAPNNSEQLPPYLIQKYGKQQGDIDNSRHESHSKNLSNISQKFPIHACVVHNDSEEIQSLANRGYSLSEQDNQLRTPLHIAVYQNNLNCVEQLLSLGANAHAVDGKHRTPLHLVCLHNCTPQIALLLIQKGKANVNCQDHKGNTPLHILSQVNRSYQVAEVLLANGADPNIKNEGGATPLECASYLQVGVDEHYVICLLKYGASLQQDQSATLIQNYLMKNEDLDRFSDDHKQVLVQFTLAAVLAKQVGSVSKMVQICIAKINEMNKLQQSVDNNSDTPKAAPHYTKIYNELVTNGGKQMEKFDEIVHQVNSFRRDIDSIKNTLEGGFDGKELLRIKSSTSRQLSKNSSIKGSEQALTNRTMEESSLPDEKYWVDLKKAMTNMSKMKSMEQDLSSKSNGQITDIFERILNENSTDVKSSIIKGVEQIEEKTSNVVKEFLKSTISDVQELKQKLLKNDADVNQEDESMTEKLDDFLEAFQEFVLYQERIQSGLQQGVNKLQNQIGTIQNEYNNMAKLTMSQKVNELRNDSSENKNDINVEIQRNLDLTTYEEKIKQLDIFSVQDTQQNINQVQGQLRSLGNTLGKIHDIVQESEFKLFANEAATFLQDFREDVRANFSTISEKLSQHFIRMEPLLKNTTQQTQQAGQSNLDKETVEKFKDLLGSLNGEIGKLKELGELNQENSVKADRSQSLSRQRDIEQLITNTKSLIDQNNLIVEQNKRTNTQGSLTNKNKSLPRSPEQALSPDSDRHFQEISQGMTEVNNQVLSQQNVLKDLQSDLRLMKDQLSLENAVQEVSESLKGQVSGFMYENHNSINTLKTHINEIVTRSTSSISESIQRIDSNIQQIAQNLQTQSSGQLVPGPIPQQQQQGATPAQYGGGPTKASQAKNQPSKSSKPQPGRGLGKPGDSKSFQSNSFAGIDRGGPVERFNRSGSYSSQSLRKPGQQLPSTKLKQGRDRASSSQPSSPHSRSQSQIEFSHEDNREEGASMESNLNQQSQDGPELHNLTESIFELFKNSNSDAQGNMKEKIKHQIAQKVKKHDSLIEGGMVGEMYGQIPLKKQQSSLSDPIHPQNSNNQINKISSKLAVIDQGIGSLTNHVETMQESMNKQNSEIYLIRDQVKNFTSIKKTKEDLDQQRLIVSGGSGKENQGGGQKATQVLNQRITSLENLAFEHNKQMVNVQGRLDQQQAILRKILEKVVILVNKNQNGNNDSYMEQSVQKSRMLPDPPANVKPNGAANQDHEIEIDSLHEKWNRSGRLGRTFRRSSSKEQSKDSQFFTGLRDRNLQHEDSMGSVSTKGALGGRQSSLVKHQSSLDKNLVRQQSSLDRNFGVNGNTFQMQGDLFDELFSKKSSVISKSKTGYIFKVDGATQQKAEKILNQESVAKIVTDARPLGSLQCQQLERSCQLNHPNIIRLMGYGESPKYGIYLVYEFFEGNSLDDVLSNQEVYRNQQLVPENRLKILKAVCNVYTYLKEQGMDYNIQPNLQKIMIDESCDVKYLDIGMPTLKKDHSLINNKFNFSHVVSGEASDVQSYGLLILQLLTGIRNKQELDSFFVKIPEILNNQNLQQDLYNYTDNSNGEWPYFLALNLFILAYKCLDQDEKERPRIDNVNETVHQLQ